MVDFANYAFNKSHAAVYAVVAYQTAYLKIYYPVEYMAALISSVRENTEKMSSYIQTCKSLGIKILPPDIKRRFPCRWKCDPVWLVRIKKYRRRCDRSRAPGGCCERSIYKLRGFLYETFWEGSKQADDRELYFSRSV